jgi:FkbM family methyltransferase
MALFIMRYGLGDTIIDVPESVYTEYTKHNVLFIPKCDGVRAHMFSDPLPNISKSVFIQDENMITTVYDNTTEIYIDIKYNKIYTNVVPEYIFKIFGDAEKRLRNMHTKLKIEFGNFSEEFPEQLMAVKYLTGSEKVLEIGGNIGRNSLIIGHIVDNNNFVSLECDVNIAKQLTHNRDINKMNFHIEDSALSKRKLIQKGWDTLVSDVVLDGYTEVKTITLDELYAKYKIDFDTLILDCEGAFYYILMDMPEILTNINLIIMENDYHDISHKEYIDLILKNNGFYVDYTQKGGWGPCQNNFFETWKKL